MSSKFDLFIHRVFIEGLNDQEGPSGASGDLSAPPTPDEGEMPPDEAAEAPADDVTFYPEEIILAKMAIRAVHFNINSKNMHHLKLKVGDEVIPFERVSDYFEKTKDIERILGFVEWVINRYEGAASKWSKANSENINQRIKKLNGGISEDERLDKNGRMDWTRIILNCLLRGSPNFNVSIQDVDESTIHEIRNLLAQSFANDSRGLFSGMGELRGPGTF